MAAHPPERRYPVTMDTAQIVAALIVERDKLNRAIEALHGATKRRGRPPKNPFSIPLASPAPTANGRKGGMTSAARKAQSRRMKAYWAKRRKEAGKKS
jgi:hypothetical protein